MKARGGTAVMAARASVIDALDYFPTPGAVLLAKGAMNSDGFRYRPFQDERPEFTTNAPRFHARITAPSAGLAIAGTLTIEELGRNPST